MEKTSLLASKALAACAAILSTMFGLLLFAASPAGAESPAPQFPITPPIENDGPLVAFPSFPIDIVALFPTANVAVSCDAETAAATVKNPTNDFFIATITVDGVLVGSQWMTKNTQMTRTFDLAENETKHVVITGSAAYDKDITRDCRTPDPSYQVLSSCATGQAHARLINNGDDTAFMAVDYPGDPNTVQPVGAHHSIDWLLEVAPGEHVDFSVRHAGGSLGDDSLSFECAQPEPEPEPQPQPQPEPQPQPQPEPQPQPQPQPQPEPHPEPQPQPEPQPSSETPADGSSGPVAATLEDGPGGQSTDLGGETTDQSPTGSEEDATMEGSDDAAGNFTETDTSLEVSDIGSVEAIDDRAEVSSIAEPTRSATTSRGGSNGKLFLVVIWAIVVAVGAAVAVVAMRRRSAVVFS